MTASYEEQIKTGFAQLNTKLNNEIKKINEAAAQNETVSKQAVTQLDDLAKKYAELEQDVSDLSQGSLGGGEARQTMGEAFSKSEAFKNFQAGTTPRAKFDFQANTITGETSSNPNDTHAPFERMPGIVPGAFRGLSILDFVPRGTTGSNAIEYTKEGTFTNAAAETAEAGQKPETDLTFTLENAPVRTIAHILKLSKQIMDDAPAVASYADRRLAYGVRLRLEQQIINGNNTAPNLGGVLAAGNSTATAVGAATNFFDYANTLKYAVIGADYQPDFYWVNPADWSAAEMVKRGSADAAYVAASGAVSYTADGLVPRLWGLPVVASNSVPVGTVVAGSSDAMMLWERQGVTVEMFEQDENNVQTNLVTLRAEMRAAFTVFRPEAIRTANLATLP